MGGSLALGLRLAHRMALEQFDLHLTLVDTNPQTRQAVRNLADHVTDDFAEGVRDADLVLLATPVRTVVRLIHQLKEVRPDGCLVMDLGSSKMAICEAMSSLPEQFSAIGGHPMCGRETAGFGGATPDMYREKQFVLCETARTDEASRAQALILLELIGAIPLWLPAEAHDQLTAVVSHLPYVVSAALMRNAAQMTHEQLWPISATGFRDTTRISGTDPTMMLDILLTNKTAVLQQLDQYQTQLDILRQLLETDDQIALRQWLTEAQAHHHTYKSQKK